ncbi:MAG: hypothetical protein PHT92_13810, partial [Bacteroidales bacterium]|nr:hypothetical protein [Bacteroidales bacterium]
FFSNRLADGSWSQPVNLGYPLNTADDNLFYQPIGDGALGLMAVFDPHGFGEKDITQVEIFLPKYQRSVVTLDEFYARRSELPPRTLVIDTANVAGVALVDPTRSEFLNYLSSDVEYTLFFDGKPYDLKDQAEELKTKATQVLEHLVADEVTPIKPTQGLAEGDGDQNIPSQEDEWVEHLPQTLEPIPAAKLDDGDGKRLQLVSADKALADTAKSPEVRADRLFRGDNQQSDRFRQVLTLLAENSLQTFLGELFSGNWDVPADIQFSKIRRMAHHADSLNYTEGVIEALAKLMDLMSTRAVEVKYRQSRRISQTSYDEDFFFRLQRLKRKASPQLAALIDEAILTQPQIASFASLWKFLVEDRYEQLKPYLNELLTLMAEAAAGGFFALGEQEQGELIIAAQDSGAKFGTLYLAIGLAVFVGLLMVVFIRRRKRSDKV